MPDGASDPHLALHSGDYVERYKAKPLSRVRNLVRMMGRTNGAAIADFACGNGMLLQVLPEGFASYDGIDFSPDFIAAAREWAEETGRSNYQFHCQDICAFCDGHPGRYDTAATLDFSEHIDDELAIRIYRAIHKSLKPGGRLFLHTPNLDFFMERAKAGGIIPQFPEHIAVRSGPQTVALLEKAGFPRRGITLKTIAHYNVLRILHPLAYLPVIGKLFGARLWIEAIA